MPVTDRTVPVYAVMPSMGRACMADAVKSLLPQVDVLYLIRTEPYEVPAELDPEKVFVINDLSRPKNISRWWNLGIDEAARDAPSFAYAMWDVLVVNDDVISPPHLTETLSAAMRNRVIPGYPPDELSELRARRPDLAYPDNFQGDRFEFHTNPRPVDLTTRISGWCFMLRGETGQRADERFEWFYGDDDIDWTARTRGGSLMVPGCAVTHLHPNELTAASAELSARTHLDRQLFDRKWSGTPH